MNLASRIGHVLLAAGLSVIWPQIVVAQVGELDLDFGTGGYVLFDEVAVNRIQGVALSGNGRIIAVGQRNPGTGPLTREAKVVTLGANGDLISNVGFQIVNCSSTMPAEYVVITPEPAGSVVVGGYTQQGCTGDPRRFWLRRLNANGGSQTVFELADPGNFAFAFDIVVQDDGKILAAGRATATSGFGAWDFALARWHADGTLDTDFGTGGVVRLDFFGEDDEAHGVVVLPDGKILIAGWIGQSGQQDIALVRFESNGSVDASFGTAGVVTLDWDGFTDRAYDMLLLRDGRLAVAGVLGFTADQGRFFIAQFNPDGSLDTSFGVAGVALPDFGDQASSALALTRQYDGKLIAVGWTETGGGGGDSRVFAIARVTPAGQLDPEFNGTGIQTLDLLPGLQQLAYSVVMQRTGSATGLVNTLREDIVIGGTIFDGSESNSIVFRLIGDGDGIYRDRFESLP